MVDILDQIKNYKLEEIKSQKNALPLSEIEAYLPEAIPVRPFYETLNAYKKNKKTAIIAELKKASPSKGIIREDFNVQDIALAYQKGGAACLSILTDTPSFMGKPSYLTEAKKVTNLPCLRKDFIFDSYQIAHARMLGADAILLIMACLEKQQAIDLEATARHYNMDILIEVHNLEELKDAQDALQSPLIGINNRNLKTFQTDLNVSIELSKHINNDKLIICESGITTKDDIKMMYEHNIHHFLIGESLMKQNNISLAVQNLLF